MNTVLPEFNDKTSLLHVKDKLKLLLLVLVVAIGGAGYFVWKQFTSPVDVDILTLSGYIEADETDIGAKTGGRLKAINVEEGDLVNQGQIIAEIADEEVPEQLNAANAKVTAAQQEEQQVKSEIDITESRIREAEVNLRQSQGDTTGRVDQAKWIVASNQSKLLEANAQVKQSVAQVHQANAQVKQSIAQVRQAEFQCSLARRNRDRNVQLFAEGAISQQQVDQAQTTFDTAQANLSNTIATIDIAKAAVETAQATVQARQSLANATYEQLAAARGGLTQAKTSILNPAIRSSQLSALHQQKRQVYAKFSAAQAMVNDAIAVRNQIQKRLESFQIKSPINGVVQSRPLEPGAVVPMGKTLLTLINPAKTYLRGYIPEGEIGKIHVGMKARVLIDSNSKQSIAAIVSAIDSKASFTPENIYFKKDRVRQVFRVKLLIKQHQSFAKPGMPADAEILLK